MMGGRGVWRLADDGQRGGEGNVHRDEGVQTHKGLADKLKDKMFKKGEK